MDGKEYTRRSKGNCIISEDVVATIAGTVAAEVEGVAGMAARSGLVGGTSGRSVRVINTENATVIDVHVNLRAGVHIQDTALEIQKRVKAEVQSMTGRPVTRVNVHVENIVLDAAEQGK